MQADVDKLQRQGDFSDGVGERPPPPPDPIYTFRPHAGEVTAVKYVALRSQGALASGYVVLLQPGCIALLLYIRQTGVHACGGCDSE